jgi:hypothetical protein
MSAEQNEHVSDCLRLSAVNHKTLLFLRLCLNLNELKSLQFALNALPLNHFLVSYL